MSDFDTLWQGANAGDPAQQFSLARHYATESDFGRSRRWFNKAARAGYPRAQVELGRQSLLGLGRAASISEALEAFQQAADAGDAEGRFELACMHYRGQGTPRNVGLAAQLLTLSARQECSLALVNYALICAENGDDPLCTRLLKKAASQGDLRAAIMTEALNSPVSAAPTDDPQETLQQDERRWCQHLPELSLLPPATQPPEIPDPQFSLRIFPQLIHRLSCIYLQETARPDLVPSHTVHPLTGESVHDDTRSSFGWSFHPGQEDIAITRVKEQLATQTGLPFSHAEPFAMLRYLPGQQYREHFDFIDPMSGEAGEEITQRGQRVATTFSYLNTVTKGGETDFPRFGQRIAPITGSAVFFRNTLDNGEIDRRSLHASLPVLDGEKWLATLWFRDRPFTP
ncbi:MAG: 2OG-Fe(II) oxygenase [Lysobacterales bacterium]